MNEYFIFSKEDGNQGPYSESVLIDGYKSGKYQAQAKVWCSEMDDWDDLGNVMSRLGLPTPKLPDKARPENSVCASLQSNKPKMLNIEDLKSGHDGVVFEGMCHNSTFKQDAPMQLNIYMFRENKVYGEIIIDGDDLGGGGDFIGTYRNNRLSITTYQISPKIEWKAVYDGHSFKGSYRVPMLFGAARQKGTWSVTRND